MVLGASLRRGAFFRLHAFITPFRAWKIQSLTDRKCETGILSIANFMSLIHPNLILVMLELR